MFHRLRSTTAAVIAVGLSFLSANTSALAAVTFTGSSSSFFGPPKINLEQDPNATFSIDSPTPGSTRFTLGKPGDSSQPNRLTFTQSDFTTTGNTPFSIGDLAFFNGQTFDGTNVSSVPLNIELGLNAIPQSRYPFQYQLAFDLTLNNTENYDSEADSLAILDTTRIQSFDFEQNTYELNLLGFSQDGGQTFARSLQVSEDQTASSTLFAQITLAAIDSNRPPTDIPEPALLSTYLLLGSLLLKKRA